jgi:hypothetical protein
MMPHLTAALAFSHVAEMERQANNRRRVNRVRPKRTA